MWHSPLVYLDTNVFIRGIEGGENESRPVRTLLDSLRDFPGAALTSELTLAELLAPTARNGALGLEIKKPLYLDLIVDGSFIDVHPVSREILIETAQLRVGFPQKLADAIHIATAISAGCRFLMSHDRDGKRSPPALTHLYPSVDGVRIVLEALRA